MFLFRIFPLMQTSPSIPFYFSVSMIIFNPSEWVSLAKKTFKLYVVRQKCTAANIVINIDITNTSKKNESVQKGRGLQRRKFLLYSTKNIIINFKIVIMFFNFLIIIFQAVVIKRKYISKSPKIK